MADEIKQEQPASDKDQLYKAAVDVINQALLELDEQENLTKGDVNEDPEGMKDEQIDPMSVPQPGQESMEGKPLMEKDLGSLQMAEDKDEEEHEEKDEPKEDEEKDEESDEDVMKAYEKCMEKMKKRGLHKAEETKPTLAKTEVKAPAPKSELEDLRKSYDGKFEELTKSIEKLTAQIEKVANQPVGRKGVSGIQPLKKNDEGDADKKIPSRPEIINKLIELQKSGNPEVTPLLVGKVESGALDSRDIEKVRRLIG